MASSSVAVRPIGGDHGNWGRRENGKVVKAAGLPSTHVVGFFQSPSPSSRRTNQPRQGKEQPAERMPSSAATPPESRATTARARVLDRWVSQQASGTAVSSVERQPDVKAELSKLSATTEPVLSRAASLIRNNSITESASTPIVINLTRPSPSPSPPPETLKPASQLAEKLPEPHCISQPAAGAAAANPRDQKRTKDAAKIALTTARPPDAKLPPAGTKGSAKKGTPIGTAPIVRNPPQKAARASSLIQMWREMEAEMADGGSTPLKRGISNSSSEFSSSFREECFMEMSFPASSSVDDNDAGWESDMSGPLSCTSDEGPEQELPSSSVEECNLAVKPNSIVQNRAANFGSSCLYHQINKFEGKGMPSNGQGMGGVVSGSMIKWGMRRAELQLMLDRLLTEKQNELYQLVQRRSVSTFPHRGRIQTFLRYRCLRQEVKIDDRHHPKNCGREQDRVRHGNHIQDLRKKFSNGESTHEGGSKSVSKNDDSVQDKAMNVCIEPTHSNLVAHDDKFDKVKMSERKVEKSKKDKVNHDEEEENESLCSENECCVHDYCRNSNDTWEETYHVKSIDWDTPLELSDHCMVKDHVFVENAMQAQQQEALSNDMSSKEESLSLIQGRHREHVYNELLETYSDNYELRQLLERRRVSISLASEFRQRLDQLILSSIKRQQINIENFEIDDNDECNTSDFAYRLDYHGQGETSYTNAFTEPQSNHHYSNVDASSFSSPNDAQNGDSIHDLRSDIAHVYYKMDALSKLIENCMKWQEKFEDSIKSELISIIHTKVTKVDIDNSPKCEPAKNVICYICSKAHVDSLLYRCGHMCTCFECGETLKQSNDACPICHVPIQDVVRANLPL